MQTVKRAQSALQHFYSTSWAEPHWLPADKRSLISGRLAAARCRPPSLAAAALLNRHPLWALWACKQMQFCISCSLDTTEAELQQVSLRRLRGEKETFYICKTTDMIKETVETVTSVDCTDLLGFLSPLMKRVQNENWSAVNGFTKDEMDRFYFEKNLIKP